jgi:hypothetical protein
MKKITALLCAAALIGALAGCADSPAPPSSPTQSPSVSPPAALKPSEYTDADFDTSGDIVVRTECDIYGSDAPWVSYTIENKTSDEFVYGVQYSVEVKLDGKWHEIPFPENTAWNDIGIMLKPNGINAHSFSFSELDYRMADGTYRLIKELGGKRYFAEFKVGPSPITAETPFGYQALEKLPEEYTAEAAEKNGDVVVTHAEVKNAGKLTDFVRKAALGIPAMVRIVQYTIEGDPIVTDIVYNENHRGYYLWRHDSSRDKFAGADKGITQTIYSYLITDGGAIYLSDCAGWEATETYPDAALIQLASDGTFGDLSEAVSVVREMTAERLKWNAARCRVFSPDTRQNVMLFGGLSYGYEGITSSEMREVGDPDGIATKITGVFWLDDKTFVLTCTTKGNLTYFEVTGSTEYQSGYGTGYTITDGKFEIVK